MVSSLFAPYGQSLNQGLREGERIMTRCPHNFSVGSRYVVSNTLSRLKSRGLIARSGSRKKAVWRITKPGRQHFKAKFLDESALPPDDGKIRLVVFDVPEKERGKRDWLRTRLLTCEYSPFQKSVWIHPFECKKELDLISEYLGMSPYTMMFAAKIENDRVLRRYFFPVLHATCNSGINLSRNNRFYNFP